jgi:hypothetical protein
LPEASADGDDHLPSQEGVNRFAADRFQAQSGLFEFLPRHLVLLLRAIGPINPRGVRAPDQKAAARLRVLASASRQVGNWSVAGFMVVSSFPAN